MAKVDTNIKVILYIIFVRYYINNFARQTPRIFGDSTKSTRLLKYTSIFKDGQPIFGSTKNDHRPLNRPASVNEVEPVCNLLGPYWPDIALGIYIWTLRVSSHSHSSLSILLCGALSPARHTHALSLLEQGG